MALTGALTADFSDFVKEADKASKAIGVMEGEAKKAGTTLAKTGAAVDGYGTAAATSATGFTDLSAGLRSVDAASNALGVSLSKPIAAIEEMGKVSTLSVASLGALGTAGAVLATAMAAWNLGRWIADLGGLDDKFAELGAMLNGSASPAAEAFGNRLDTVRRAILAGGTDVQTFEQAVAFLRKKTEDYTESLNTSTHRVSIWNTEIAKAAQSGNLAQIEADLESQNSTLQQLSKHYDISTEALQFLQRQLRQAAEATREYAEADKKAAAEAQARADAQQKLRDQMFGTDAVTQAAAYVEALGSTANLTRMTQEEQTKLNAVLGEAIASLGRIGEVAPQAMRDWYNATVSIGPVVTGLGSEFANLGTKFTPTADAIIADIGKMRAETAAYEAETQRMVDAAQQIAPPIATAKTETQQLSYAIDAAATAMKRTASESIAMGQQLESMYRNAGIFVGQQIATGGYQQSRRLAAGSEITGAGQAWGNTLNVNVNSTEAGDISKKLVDEMRRNGVRF